jgi:23S rRNA (cytosine1962-C5)-methyltransferase
MSGKVIIKKGREKPILQQHPWIFSGAIAHAENANPGDIVTVYSHDNKFLARGYWNPKSQIQVRILTWQDEEINDDWWRQILKRAIQGRRKYLVDAYMDTINCRLVNAENDFIPGLIVDLYGKWIVLQALTLYIDIHKHEISSVLVDLMTEYNVSLDGVYERSDIDVRHKEGLPETKGLLWGVEPPELVKVHEAGNFVLVDIRNGHKTGYYLDQQGNRALLGQLLSEMRFQAENLGHNPSTNQVEAAQLKFLNLFSYTCGFGLIALDFPSESFYITNVDSSQEVFEIAKKTLELNGISRKKRVEFVRDDVFDYLRRDVARSEQYDVIVCDPPKFAHNAGQVEKAARGYKDLNLHCFKLVRPGGYLMTFSCSGAVSADLFQKIVFGALADSGRQAQILKHLGPGDDHPVALTFPEGAYLKGLLLRVY